MTKALPLADIRTFLNTCTREELVDRVFQDAEVYWYSKPEADEMDTVAVGYFGTSGHSVSITSYVGTEYIECSFDGDEALELRKCGTLTKTEYNDESEGY